ncbi:MAG: hypothetical protein ACT4PL_11070, partial [Phycisphaerales bacterium]
MIHQLLLASTLALTEGASAHAAGSGMVVAKAAPQWFLPAALLPLFPIIGVVLATVFAALRVKNKLPAFASVGCLAASFVCAVLTYLETRAGIGGLAANTPFTVHVFDWLTFNWAPGLSFVANFSFYIDTLTCLWMLFVTGLATLIALYASEYMSHDQGVGYCRFFAAFNLFVFSMSCLVMV